MLEQLIYKNHVNEVIEFGKYGIFIDTNDLHDYEWDVTTKNNRVASLGYKVAKRKLPIVIMCETEAEGIAARNKLMEVTEKDVLALQHGRIIVGDYYFRCFVTKSQKKKYQRSKRYMEATLTLTTDFPFWVKETTVMFKNGGIESRATGNAFLDFDYDYPHDYYASIVNTDINNTGFVKTNFKMVIYGSVSNPTVDIGGHIYQVNCTIPENAYLTIDSASKKIFLTEKDGTVTNKFNDRNRDSYIFEKIPAGKNLVAWDGKFAFDIILMEERSEPIWT